ncbi:MAG: DMT family transporter [Hyphomicrobiales bacterium]
MAQSATRRAILWLCLGVLVFSLQDIIIKTVSGSYPVHEVIVIRCVGALPILIFLVHKSGGLRTIRSPRAASLWIRSCLLLISYTTYFLAFPVLPLASIVALYATVPLFVTALAGPVLGETISAPRWGVVILGFIGALIMIWPDTTVFEVASILPIVSALAYAGAQIMARKIGLSDSAAVMSFYQNLLYLIVAGLFSVLITFLVDTYTGHPSLEFMLRPWVAPALTDFFLIVACGPIAAIGMTMLGQAYRLAEANTVAPFEYTGLLWGALWGFLLWSEVPGVNAVIGAALIVAGGMSSLSIGKYKTQLS